MLDENILKILIFVLGVLVSLTLASRAKQTKISIFGYTGGGTSLGLCFKNEPSFCGFKFDRGSCTITSAILTDTKTNDIHVIRECWTDQSGLVSNVDSITIKAGETAYLEIFQVNQDYESFSVRDDQAKIRKKYNLRETKFKLELKDSIGRKHKYHFLISFKFGSIQPIFEFSFQQRLALAKDGLGKIIEALTLKRFK
jgi:hypothetical protein